MPIYCYRCRDCRDEFEAIVLNGRPPTCPRCQATDLERQPTAPALSTEAGRRRTMQHARSDARNGAWRDHDEFQRELRIKHDEH